MGILDRNGKFPQIKPRPTNFLQGGSFSVPAPYGGLNLREDITALQPNEARVLENFQPSTGLLTLRPGFADYADGMGTGEVKTLATFQSPSLSKLVAGTNGKLFDVSSSGSATQIGSGFTEDRWQFDIFNSRVFFVNGTDAPQDWDGATLTSTAWTGMTKANLINVALVRNRLWFCEKNQAYVWYAGIASVTGGLTKFDLSQIANGGYCMAIGSWSRDAGDGSDDFTVFVMSTGELLIYQGDPATTFSLQGRYSTGAAPVGRRCLFKVGGELVVITRLGLLPVSAAIAGVALDLSRIDPWGKIAPLVVMDARIDGDNAGWHGVLHEGLVYVNVPQTPGVLSKQYVLNTRNGSWTVYTGWNASSIASFNNVLYVGAQTAGLVNEIGAADDNGEDIVALANGAFVTPSGPSKTNMFTGVRPKIQANGSVSGIIGVDTDYVVRSLAGTPEELIADTSTTPWGSAWGSSWAQPNQSDPQWFTIEGAGRAVAVRIRVIGKAQNFEWYATDVLLKAGSIK